MPWHHNRVVIFSVRPEPVTDGGLIKIWFRFVPREGWPAFDTEGLWAEPVDEDTARLRNVPFLLEGVAEDDRWRYVTLQDGRQFAAHRVAASGNCTIRVLPNPDGPLGRSARQVLERFVPFGIGGESYSADFPLVAMTIPATADLAGVKDVLERGQTDGWWYWEGMCVTPTWNALWEQ